MAKTKVSSFGLKILKRIEAGGGLKMLSDGSLKAGRFTAPPSVLKNLIAEDLVRIGPRGLPETTEAGTLYLRRAGLASGRRGRSENRTPGLTPFQRQHRQEITALRQNGRKRERVTLNIGDSPLAWLLRRKGRGGKPLITRAQFEAGERLAREFELAGLLPRTTGHYDGIPIPRKRYGSARPGSPSEFQIEAKRRVHSALRYAGPGLSDILVRVCCFHEGLEQAERTLEWPSRSGKLVLRLALERLCDYYDPERTR